MIQSLVLARTSPCKTASRRLGYSQNPYFAGKMVQTITKVNFYLITKVKLKKIKNRSNWIMRNQKTTIFNGRHDPIIGYC